MRIWIAADVKSPDGRVWEMIGAFDSSEKADAACTEGNHAYWSIELNAIAPKESTIALDVRWPRNPNDPAGAGLIEAKAN